VDLLFDEANLPACLANAFRRWLAATAGTALSATTQCAVVSEMREVDEVDVMNL